MRYLYSFILFVSIPLILLRLRLRAIKLPQYRLRWRERFGVFPFSPSHKPVVWLHTVSVGEFIAAKAIADWILLRGDAHLVITTTTPTGSAQVVNTFGAKVFHVYAPYDLPFCLSTFLNKTQPKLAIFMETELWPNTLYQCSKRGIPTLLANGRLSEKSAQGYARVSWLTRPMLQNLTRAAIQHSADAERFAKLGLAKEKITITGSIKFDLSISGELKSRAAQLRQQLSHKKPRSILIAASTHKGEDEIILAALQQMRLVVSDILLVLVPRHPDRFEDVLQLCKTRGFNTARRSTHEPVNETTDILLGDTLGELLLLFGCADIAFVGGSLVTNGGHNYLEPAAWGLPILSGPSTFNFAEIANLLIECKAMTVVSDAETMAVQAIGLFANPNQRMQMGQSARTAMEGNKGALKKLKEIISSMLTQTN